MRGVGSSINSHMTAGNNKFLLQTTAESSKCQQNFNTSFQFPTNWNAALWQYRLDPLQGGIQM
jgi:hypothetical protein